MSVFLEETTKQVDVCNLVGIGIGKKIFIVCVSSPTQPEITCHPQSLCANRFQSSVDSTEK